MSCLLIPYQVTGKKNIKGRIQLYTRQGNLLGDNKSFCIDLAALIGKLSYWIKFELKKEEV